MSHRFGLTCLCLLSLWISSTPLWSQPIPINLGDTVTGEIAQVEEEDAYSFSVPPGQVVFLDAITSSNTGGINWKLEDRWGTQLLGNFVSFGDLGPVPLLGGDDYVVTVLGEGLAVGTYEFVLVGVANEVGPINVGDMVVGDLAMPGQRDDYTFTATPGQKILIDVTATSNSGGLNWILEDTLGRTILSRTTSLGDRGPFVLQGGDYVLSVIGEGGSVGSYEFTLVDVVDESFNVLVGSNVSGNLTPGQTDRFNFTATSGQLVFFDLITTSNSSGLNWIFEDDAGRVLLSRTTSLGDRGPFLLLAGDYQLTIVGEGAASGTYEFNIVDVTNSSTMIAIGDAPVGAIDESGEQDVFTFNALEGQTVYLDVITTSNTSNLNWMLEDSYGRSVLARTTSLVDRGPFRLVAGVHTLTILGESGSVGTYEFRLVEVQDRGMPITIGAPVSDALVNPGEKNLYSFTAPANQIITIDQTATSNSSGLNWILEDSLGRPVVSRTTTLGDVGPLTLFGGTYELTVIGEAAATGTYEFELLDQGVGSFTSSGTSINVGDTISDAIDMSGDVDVYNFTVAAGQSIYLDLLVGSNNLHWTLLDPVGQPVFGLVRARFTDSEDRGPFVLQAGTYQLELSDTAGGTPAYEFQVVNVVDSSGTINVGDVVADTFTIPGSTRTLDFTVAEGQTIYVDLQVGNPNLFWSLAKAGGQAIFDLVRASNTGSEDRGPFTLTAGTYVLTLDPRYHHVPAYQFQIVEVLDETIGISVGDSVTDTFATAGSTKSYSFSVAAGQEIYLDLQAGSTSLFWTLLDPIGQPVFGLVRASNVTSEDRGPFALDAGTYTLVLDPSNSALPSYTFQIVEVNDLISSFALGDVVTDTFTSQGAIHQYSFTLAAPTRVFFDNQLSATGAFWTLRDSAGAVVSTLSNVQMNSTTGSDRGPITLSAGTYELSLNTSGGVQPTYQFQALQVIDFSGTLAIDVPVTGAILSPGGTATFTFTAAEGQRVLFDSLGNSASIRWTLFNEQGISSGLFANNTSSTDRGPFDLVAGTYTLLLDAENSTTPSYDFVVRNVAADLVPTMVSSSPSVFFESATGATLDVTWTVINDASGPAISSSWTDRVLLSPDTALGDGDDIVLGEFINSPPLEPRAEYTRTEIVSLPDGLEPGEYFLYVSSDINDEVVELGGESNNNVSTRVANVPGSGVPSGCLSFDLDPGTAFPAGSVVAISGRAAGFSGSVNVIYAVDVSLSTQNLEELDCNFNGILDADDDLNGDGTGPGSGGAGGSILDCEIGATLIVDEFIAQNATSIHASVVFSETAATLDLSPAPFQQSWNTPFDVDDNGNMIPDFEEVMRSLYSIGGFFCLNGTGANLFTSVNTGCATNFRGAILETDASLSLIGPADQQLLIFLTDGEPVPAENVPSDEELAQLADRGIQFQGFQIGSGTVTPALQRLADEVDASPISSGSARSVLDTNDLLFEIVQAVDVIAVTVNGVQADSVDVAGNFFHVVTIEPGENCFEVVAFDASGGECFETLCLEGIETLSNDPSQFQDVTTSLEVEYSNTTFNQALGTLVVHAQAQNVSEFPVDGPVLMVVENLSQPSVSVANPDGYTLEGNPYFEMVDQAVKPVLNPLDFSPTRALLFDNPNQVPVFFDISWLALGNQPPYFTTVPGSSTLFDQPYLYESNAVDPNQQPLIYSLDTAPLGMSIDPVTGVVAWTPVVADIGLHAIVVVASDTRGGRAVQSYSLEVLSAGMNRPPVFTSAPDTHSAVGATYSYQATADDPDGNAITFTKLAGPADLVVALDGLVQWDFTLPGDYSVTIRVSDGAGGFSDQTYVLSVGSQPTNPNAPRLFGTPSALATVGNLYLYQPSATDLDSLDVLTFSLSTSPAGMTIDPSAGTVTWTPDAMQLGLQAIVLEVDDGNGATTTQSWSVEVFDEPLNQPPVITSTPGFSAIVGEVYSYPVAALDPEGLSVDFSLVSPPSGMVIDPQSGLLTWTPDTQGTFTVAIKATDPMSAFGSQVYEVMVGLPNTDPVVNSMAVLTATVGATYRYDVDAADVNGDVLRYFLTQSPAGMTINEVTGLISWVPSQPGDNDVTVLVDDGRTGSVTQSFTVTVTPDTEFPVVEILFTQVPAAVDTPLQICIGATDNVGISDRSVTVDGVPVPLELNGCGAFLPPSTPGSLTVVASATDPSGNVTQAMADLLVVDPSDPEDPVVTILSPVPDAVITEPTPIVASIADNSPATLTWELRIARQGSDDFTTIGAGSGEVTDGILAIFDPSMLPNDQYRIQIVGNDGVQTGGIEFEYSVAGNYKMGNFSYEFTDLVFQIAGIPLSVTRQYNTLDTSVGDFGAGWRLGLPGRVSDSAMEADTGTAFGDLLATEPFQVGTRVYVTRPDGRRVGFSFDPIPLPFPQAFQWIPRFEPDPGVTDTLEAESISGSGTVWNFGTGFVEFVIPFNPSRFFLTTAEGVKYTISEELGLEQIEDVFGNTIDVTPDGLFSSTGVTVAFERDSQGRITTITEPPSLAQGPQRPAQLSYEYDANGNLIRFTDLEGLESLYFYDDPQFLNYLTGLEDPLGRSVLRNVYDSGGRLIAQCDESGNFATLDGCITIDNDSLAGIQTVTTARGLRIDYFIDGEGRVTKRRRFLEDGVDFVDDDKTYDADGNLLSLSTGGGTSVFTYDAAGNVLTQTGPDGETFSFTYDPDCNLVASETDPAGNVTTYQYDAECNLRFITDPLGGVIELRYDIRGDVTDFIDQSGNQWQFTYDRFGYPETTVDPLGNAIVMEFNAAGDLLWQIDRNGDRIDFEYDAEHRLVKEIWDTTPPREITYTYNDAGAVTSVTDPDSTVTVEYWNTGAVRSVDNAGTPGAPNVAVTYGYLSSGRLLPGYDGGGNVTHVMDSLGGMTEYQYNQSDSLVSIQQYPAPEVMSTATPVNEKVLDVEYNAEELLSRALRYADLARAQPVVHTDFEYSCVGCDTRMSAIRHRRATDNAVVHDLEYVRDVIGNVTEIGDAEGTHSYTYDGDWRLIGVSHPGGGPQQDETYSYNSSGNRSSSHLSSGYLYSSDLGEGGSQLRQDDSYDYLFDANGQVIRQTDRQTGEYYEFSYDHRTRLTDIARFDRSQVELSRQTFTYDGLDRRIKADDGVNERWYVYDDLNPILVLDSAGTILSRRMYGLVNDDILADQDGTQTRWYLNDETGTLRDLVDNAANSIAHFIYDTFGQLLDVTPAGVDTGIGFTARETLDGLPFVYFRARLYDPALGRFTQEDPYDPFQYHYVDNNPLSFSDALGFGPLAEYRPIIAGGINWLYVGCEAGKVVYVGITRNPTSRAAAHARMGRTFKFCKIKNNLSRKDARALEQALIDGHGGPGKGAPGRLINKINSVAPGKPLAQTAKGFLKRLGGPSAVAGLTLCLLCL